MEYLSWEKGYRGPHGVKNNNMVAPRTVVLIAWSWHPFWSVQTIFIILLMLLAFLLSFSHKFAMEFYRSS